MHTSQGLFVPASAYGPLADPWWVTALPVVAVLIVVAIVGCLLRDFLQQQWEDGR